MARKTDLEYLKEEILIFEKRVAQGTVLTAQQALVKKAKSYMGQYYEDLVQPKRYVRTCNLKNNAIEPIYRNIGNRYCGGVRISASKMDNYSRLTPISGLLGRRRLKDIQSGSPESFYPKETSVNVVEKFLKGSHYRNAASSADVRTELTRFFKDPKIRKEWQQLGLKYALRYPYKYINKKNIKLQ